MKELFSKILRYGPPSEDASVPDFVSLGAVEKHIETHLGKPSLVLHEIGSRYVHIDVHVIPPQPGRNFYTLVTSGMSDKPMKAPKQAEGLEYAELMLCLPGDWIMETALCGWVLLELQLVSDAFKVMTSDDGRKTLFHAAVPVYKEEMDLKLREGAEKLQDLFVEKGITELVDPRRPNAVSILR